MIKCDKSEVCIAGHKLDIMAEITEIIHDLVENCDFTWEDIAVIVDTAKMSEEELNSDIDRLTDKLTKEFDISPSFFNFLANIR